ncbi:MAG: hypothetical protein HS116_20450 [Planctomycetes bacterium]|nr:hypothetical protein [Planctomycetota bacterium]
MSGSGEAPGAAVVSAPDHAAASASRRARAPRPRIGGEPDDAGLEVRRRLREEFDACGLLRPYRATRYDPGTVLDVPIQGVAPATLGRARIELDRFLGGGFAGQVYRARLLDVSWQGAPVEGLVPGRAYAVKLLRPPGSFAGHFRDLLYKLGYQAPFGLQSNPDAARAGALWQKLIRRAASIRFGSDRHVADVHATFFDPELLCSGELLEWVDGRVWKLESDARLFERKAYRGADPLPPDAPSPEYLEKRRFMARLTQLFHEVGAHELARQYEWSTWKSQPNVLKRRDGAEELCAIDWRPGLALLFGMPMSPGDVKLIFKGLARGRLAQFDGCDLGKLDAFVAAHAAAFEDLRPAIAELKGCEARYRAAQPDGLNRPWRLAALPFLREVRSGIAAQWSRKGLIDGVTGARAGRMPHVFGLYYLLWWLPILGAFLMRCAGHATYRRHALSIVTRPGYLLRAMRAWRIETLMRWHRNGRLNDAKALARVGQPIRFNLERATVGWWPRAWHRFMTDRAYAWGVLRAGVGFPIYFYRSAEFREAWLLERLRKAQADGMVTPVEEARIEGHIRDPFIQKYLKCMAVHLALSPFTTVLRLGLAIYFSVAHGDTWHEALAIAVGVLAALQLLPVTPGSLARGLYVVWLMIRERNVHDYRIAAIVSFWHYIGYLGFPLQMATRFPSLARFLAARWAKNLVGWIPVFGENGALLEHLIFDAVFNLPLSLRARWVKSSAPELAADNN